MRYNPNDETQLERLKTSMDWSKTKMLPFRKTYMDVLKFYVGSHYGEDAKSDKTPINSLRMAVDIYSRSLAAQNPNVLALTYDANLKPQAMMLEVAVNELLKEINLTTTLREAVKSALFMMGIVKVGLAPPDMQPRSPFFRAGEPYAEPVLFDDWLHDMTARRFGELDWCANRYRLPLEWVLENDSFDAKAKNKLKPQDGGGYVSDGMEDNRSNTLSMGTGLNTEEYKDHVELWDIWLPHDQLLVTTPVEWTGTPLSVVEWEGPRRGPFHILSLAEVPGNLMPAAPALMWLDLHDLMNRLFSKLGRQAERQKTVTFAGGTSAQDRTAERITNAEDGQVVRVDDPAAVKEVRYGGVDAANAAFVMQLKELFSYIGGNLDSLGGLGQQGDTLGQERMIRTQSSMLLEEMSDRVINFTSEIVGDLAYYIYTDPITEIPLTTRIQGYDENIPFDWTPADRVESFTSFRIKLEPYSMQAKSPSSRLSGVFNIVQNVITPFAQQMQMQGLEVDVEHLLNIAAKYSDLPELLDIIKVGGMSEAMLQSILPGGSGGGGTAAPAAPPNPNKPNGQYTRTSQGGTAPSNSARAIQSFNQAASKQS